MERCDRASVPRLAGSPGAGCGVRGLGSTRSARLALAARDAAGQATVRPLTPHPPPSTTADSEDLQRPAHVGLHRVQGATAGGACRAG